MPGTGRANSTVKELVNNSPYSARVDPAPESSVGNLRVGLIALGFTLVSLVGAMIVLSRSNGPSDEQLLTGREGAERVERAALSDRPSRVLATRWNARTILASAQEGDTPAEVLERFFGGLEPKDLFANPALAAAASADFFATVFPNSKSRPQQSKLANAAEGAYRGRVTGMETRPDRPSDPWMNAFVFSFADTLEAHDLSGVQRNPIVAIVSGTSEPGGPTLAWSKDGSILVRSAFEGPSQLWSFPSATTVGDTMSWPTTEPSEVAAAISPDGANLAVIATGSGDSEAAQLRVRAAAGRSERVVATSDPPRGIAWSPDGANLAVRDSTAISVYDATTLEQRARWVLPEEGFVDPPLSIAWSPDATRLAYTTNLADAIVRDVATGAVVSTFVDEQPSALATADTPRITRIGSLAWAADGKRIVSVADGDGVVVWDAASGAPLMIHHGEVGVDAQWLSDDRVLVKAKFSNRRFEWTVRAGGWTPTLPGFDFDTMAVSSDGQFVATARSYDVVIRKVR